MTRKLQSLSCIIPALNEYENLQVLLPKLVDLLREKVALKIILVDDGSTDATPQLFAEWKQRVNFQYIQFSRNFGKESALAAGCLAVDTQAAVILDADMQHPPELILDMIKYWEEGYDMVYTYREHRQDESALKKYGTSLFYRLFFSRQAQMPQNAGDFRLLDIRVVQALNNLPERRRFTKGLYHWVGFTTKAIPYVPPERYSGKSRFNLVRLLILGVDGITSFSVRPLRLALVLGAMLSVFGFSYMIWLIIEWFIHDVLKGFTTIVVLICLLFGVLFLILGVIGEYIGKIFEESKQRPLFIVAQNLLSDQAMAAYQKYQAEPVLNLQQPVVADSQSLTGQRSQAQQQQQLDQESGSSQPQGIEDEPQAPEDQQQAAADKRQAPEDEPQAAGKEKTSLDA